MDTKLTLQLDKTIIEKAKIYSRREKSSLSALVENIFYYLTSPPAVSKNKTATYPPITAELSGIIKAEKISQPKEKYTNYLRRKYQ